MTVLTPLLPIRRNDPASVAALVAPDRVPGDTCRGAGQHAVAAAAIAGRRAHLLERLDEALELGGTPRLVRGGANPVARFTERLHPRRPFVVRRHEHLLVAVLPGVADRSLAAGACIAKLSARFRNEGQRGSVARSSVGRSSSPSNSTYRRSVPNFSLIWCAVNVGQTFARSRSARASSANQPDKQLIHLPHPLGIRRRRRRRPADFACR